MRVCWCENSKKLIFNWICKFYDGNKFEIPFAITLVLPLLPAIVPLLGFREKGILEGSLAAKFQSYFLGGNIPKERLFSYLQHLGTKLPLYKILLIYFLIVACVWSYNKYRQYEK